MIFARRAIQRRLNELRPLIGESAVDALVVRLNKAGRDRLAAMWEVVILHASSKVGTIRHEVPLQSGRKPDLTFDDGTAAFVADITSVSDDGLHDQNPFTELMDLVRPMVSQLGLGPAGIDLRVESKLKAVSGGHKRVLRLPARERLHHFVHHEIKPLIREQIGDGRGAVDISIENEQAALRLSIDPRRAPYNSGSYAAYDIPTVIDKNSLFNALTAKADQLAGAEGIAGIIVGDGGTATLSNLDVRGRLDAGAIADEFLRRHSSIHFVLLIGVRHRSSTSRGGSDIRLQSLLKISKKAALSPSLVRVLERIVAELPKPANSAVNGALRAREAHFDRGYHGGHEMSGNRIKISAREMMEVLAGRRTVAETNSMHQWSDPDAPTPTQLPNPFELRLREGRLPSSISVVRTDENQPDDWIEIEFADRDAAINPFR